MDAARGRGLGVSLSEGGGAAGDFKVAAESAADNSDLERDEDPVPC